MPLKREDTIAGRVAKLEAIEELLRTELGVFAVESDREYLHELRTRIQRLKTGQGL